MTPSYPVDTPDWEKKEAWRDYGSPSLTINEPGVKLKMLNLKEYPFQVKPTPEEEEELIVT